MLSLSPQRALRSMITVITRLLLNWSMLIALCNGICFGAIKLILLLSTSERVLIFEEHCCLLLGLLLRLTWCWAHSVVGFIEA